MNIKALDRKIAGLEKIITINEGKIEKMKKENQERKKEVETLIKLRQEYYELEERMSKLLFPKPHEPELSNTDSLNEQISFREQI